MKSIINNTVTMLTILVLVATNVSAGCDSTSCGEGPFMTKHYMSGGSVGYGYTAIESCSNYIMSNLGFRHDGIYLIAHGSYDYYDCSANCNWVGGLVCIEWDNGGFLSVLPVTGGYDVRKNFGDQCEITGNGTNPINAATGNKVQVETDYIDSTHGLLNFKRTYNSLNNSNNTDNANGSFGVAWTHTFSSRLFITGPAQALAYISRPDGNELLFKKSGNEWTSEDGGEHALIENADTWVYKKGADYIETYDKSGKLVSINKNGFLLQLSYQNELLDTVIDTFQRKMVFEYYSNGRIKLLTLPNELQIHYTYDNNSNLVSVSYDGVQRKYLYDNATYKNALTGIIDENGSRFATWQYDSHGRAITSKHAGDTSSHVLTFNADGTTTITNPFGKKTTYHFTTIQGVRKVTQVEGHPTTSCEGANKSYSYDANGNISSKTDWNGVTTNYTYDMDRNLELTRTEAVGTPQERTITTEWPPQFRLPTKITEPGKITEYTYDAQGRLMSSKVSSVQ